MRPDQDKNNENSNEANSDDDDGWMNKFYLN